MIKHTQNFIGSKKKGFTLLETLIAITVLLIAITGPLQIAAQALFSAFYSRDQITAYYLAAEAIEFVKNYRDGVFLNDVFNEGAPENNNWLLGLVGDGGSGAICEKTLENNGCIVDSRTGAITPCLAGCPIIKKDDTTGIWGYDVGSDTKFTRTVEISPQPTNSILNEAMIKVTVRWTGGSFGGADKKVELDALMTNWERQ